MKKIFKYSFPLGKNRGSIRAYLTLINILFFSIMIIADLIAYFLDKDLTLLLILTLLTGGLTALSQGWYFGQRMYQDPERPVKQFLAKPSVRSIEYPITDEKKEKIIRERFE